MRPIISPFTGSLFAIAALSLAAPAQANPATTDANASALTPLNQSQFGPMPETDRAAVEAGINAEMDAAKAPSEDMLDLSDLPLVQDFMNESGEVGLSADTPISIMVTDSFGDRAVGLDYSF
ncbi:MAG: hypothetical protein AAFQ61_12845 [Cyanobacteria bacterium J06626_23]